MATTAAIGGARPFRDDALGADLAHRFEQRRAVGGHVVDDDDALAAGRADDVAQQRLAVLDRTAL
jgi:hypothetical protein